MSTPAGRLGLLLSGRTEDYLHDDPDFTKEQSVFQNLAKQQQNASALAQLAQQTPGGPQGAPDGPPTPQQAQTIQQAQQANDPTQQQGQFYSALQQLGAINPNKYGQAAAQTSPLAQMGNLAALQLQKADAAAKQTESIKAIPHPDGTTTLYDGNMNTKTIGTQIPMSDEGKKLHDFLNLNGQMGDNLAAQPSMGANIQNQIKYAMMTPDQQKAQDALSEQKAKAIQDADQAVIDTKAQRDQILPSLNQMDAINDRGNLPSVMPEEQAEGSNLFHSMGMGTGATANDVSNFSQLNSGEFVNTLKSFLAGGGGARMDVPVVTAMQKAGGVPLAQPQQGRKNGINQLRLAATNQVIAAQNKAAQLRDPNATVTPELPMNTNKKIFTMQEVNDKAAQRKMNPSDIIKLIQSSGNLVAQ